MTGVRELHWHTENEWAYMLSGTARITAVDQFGGSFVDDVNAGDLWFFPSGIPHSIQAHSDGCEFLLVFDDGSFSENGTLLLTDLLIHTPPEVVAKAERSHTGRFLAEVLARRPLKPRTAAE